MSPSHSAAKWDSWDLNSARLHSIYELFGVMKPFEKVPEAVAPRNPMWKMSILDEML